MGRLSEHDKSGELVPLDVEPTPSACNGEEADELGDQLTSLPTSCAGSVNEEGASECSLCCQEELARSDGADGLHQVEESANNGQSGGVCRQQQQQQQVERQISLGAATSGQFNRLDPHRRSFSTPSVNTVAQQRLTGRGVAKTASKRLFCNSAGSQEQKLWRRRTALGLISSLGTASGKLPQPVAEGQSQQPPVRLASWRSWFSAAKLLASNQAESTGNNGGEVGRQASVRASGTRRFLLRNLAPQSLGDTRASPATLTVGPEQQQAQQVACAEPATITTITLTAAGGHQLQVADEEPRPSMTTGLHVELALLDDGTQSDRAIGGSSLKSDRPSQSRAKSEYASNQDRQTAFTEQPERGDEEESKRRASEMPTREQVSRPPGSLVDWLVDSELDWRQLMRETNQSASCLSELSESQMKRQEVIHELIQTERHHCLTLALMRQVYLNGLSQLNEWRLRQHSGPPSSEQRGPQATANPQQPQVLLDKHGQPVILISVRPPSTSLALHHQRAIEQQQQPHHHQQQAQVIECWVSAQGDPIDLERLFPALEDLIAAHELLFAHLRLKLVESCQPADDAPPRRLVGLVGPLGDLLLEQFKLADPKGAKHLASNGHKLLQAYSKFCGQHYDSSRYYKQLMQQDKGFKQFIETCNRLSAACRQRGIPECNLLVTQRLTKYPLLIEQLIKSSKDEPEDEERKLREALQECRRLLAELNNQLARKESFERLLDIYAQFCPKSYTIYNRHLRFTKHDLLQQKRLRQLLHSDGQVRIWSATRRKLFQVLCLILNDIVVFLRIENTGQPAGQPPPSAASLSSLPGLYLQQEGHLHHHHHQECDHHSQLSQLVSPMLNQCALINVVVSAFHSPAGPYQSLPPVQVNSTGLASSGAGQANQQQQVRYYFANIDNKPSVISLSKLLIREKAANEPEPRIYLISSSPRQPEMYELAFVSKRHQESFVDKLKSCIEQHNRTSASDDMFEDNDEQDCCCSEGSDLVCVRDVDDYDLRDRDDDEDDDDEDDEDRNENDDDVDNDDLDEQLDDRSMDLVGPREQLAHDDLSTQSAHQNRTPTKSRLSHRRSTQYDTPTGCTNQNQSMDCFVDATQSPAASLADEESSRRRRHETDRLRSNTLGDFEFELDIERDIIAVAPDRAPSDKSEDKHEEKAESDEDEDECQLASNESGLSERARDSMDESSRTPSVGVAKLKQRRRRARGPRNASNQSSSSEEAAGKHRQAIELIGSTCRADQQQQQHPAGPLDSEEFDSGRGHDDSSSAASTSSNSLLEPEKLSQPSKPQADLETESCQKSKGSKKRDKLLDFKLLKGSMKSLSSSSISSTLASTSGPTTAEAGQTSTTRNSSSSPTSELPLCQTGSCKSSASSVASSKATSGSGSLVKCPSSVAGKTPLVAPTGANTTGTSKQQRKLSTVSTMSSQLKLFNRLKGNTSQLENPSIQQHRQQLYPTNFVYFCSHCGGRNVTTNPNTGSLSQQSSLSKQMRQQIRRSSFVPEQKLEELRDLRIQLDKDKQEWQSKFDKMQEELLNERRELDLARDRLKQDRQQVANEREQLYRKLDVLKEKGILLSPSHKVIITTPEASNRLGNHSTNNQNSHAHLMGGAHQDNQLPPQYGGQLYQRQPLHTIQPLACHNQSPAMASQQQSVMVTPSRYGQTASCGLNNTTSLFISTNNHHLNNQINKVPLHLSESGKRLARAPLASGTTGTRIESHVI